MLTLYRRAIGLRRQLADASCCDLSWLPAPGQVLDFRRGSLRCVVNLGPDDHPLDAEPVVSSQPTVPGNRLPPDGAAWLAG